jgi:hypothetical protein
MAGIEHPARSTLGLDDVRIEQLMLWHGTDEDHLPPAHTLQNLSRDTVAALTELLEARQTIAQLRAAMGRAFWSTDLRELHAIVLQALGPPGEDAGPHGNGRPMARDMIQRTV